MSFLKDDLELEWGARLRNVSLVAEAIKKDDDIQAACRIVGAFIKDSNNPRAALYEYPALVLFTVTAIGGSEYSEGTLWKKISDAYNIPNKPSNFDQLVGEAYLNGLKHFGLNRYKTPKPYMGVILIHATIPKVSQPKFLRKLTAEYNNNPSLTGELFNNKFRFIQSSDVQANEIDKPIWHFIRETGAFADLFVDRCIELIIDLADGIRDENGGEGLPEEILESMHELIKSGLRIKQHKAGSRKVGELKPHVYYSEEFEELRVFLPPLEQILGRDVQWEVSIGDQIEKLSRFRPLNGISPEVTSVPLLSPGQKVIAREVLDGREWSIELYGEESFLILLGEDSKLLPTKGPLPRGIVTAIYPTVLDKKNNFIRTTGTPESQNLGALNGWAPIGGESNWSIMRIDLSDVDQIWLEDSAGNVIPRSPRYVNSSRNPRIDFTTAAVPDTMTVEGFPVLSSLPLVQLPGISGNSENNWKILISTSENTWFEDSVQFSLEDKTYTPSFNIADGLYTLHVEGRSGTRISKPFYFAPDLEIEITPNYRPIAQDGCGLIPALVKDKRSDNVYELGPGNLSVQILGRDDHEILISPRHMSIQTMESRALSRKFFESIRINKEDLFETRLRIGIDKQWGNSLVLKDRFDKVLHQENGTSDGDAAVSFNLAKFSESVASSAFCHLYLYEPAGTYSYVAQVSPRKILQKELLLEDGSLVIQDEEIPENLRITFYSKYAPWVKPVQVKVSEHVVPVPESISELGPFSVTAEIGSLFSFDPVSPRFSAQNPNSQRMGTIIEVLPDTPERAFVHWLLTGTKTELMQSVDVSILWHCLTDSTVSGSATSKVTHKDVENFCAEQLNADPGTALSNFPIRLHENDTELKLLFLADLIDEKPNEPVIDASNRSFAQRSPALFAVLSAGEISREGDWKNIAIDIFGKSGIVLSEDDEFLDWDLAKMARSRNLMQGPIAHPHFNISVEDLYITYLNNGIVPGGIWDANDWPHQFLYIRKAADNVQGISWLRNATTIQNAISLDNNLADFVNDEAYSLCRKICNERSIPPTTTMIAGVDQSILAIPAISLRLAIAARLAARGHSAASIFWHDNKQLHQMISTLLPKLVEFDIVLAELTVSLNEGQNNESN